METKKKKKMIVRFIAFPLHHAAYNSLADVNMTNGSVLDTAPSSFSLYPFKIKDKF